MARFQFNNHDVARIAELVGEMAQPDNHRSQALEQELIQLLSMNRERLVSSHDAVNRILRLPRAGPYAGGYNDNADYSEFVEDRRFPSIAGYSDIREPQPGGGYADYSQWIDDRIGDILGNPETNPVVIPGEYQAYAQWLPSESGTRGSAYNDGPVDLKGQEIINDLVPTKDFLEELCARNLLSTFVQAVFAAREVK